jgi:hypothetical protein
MTEVTLKETDYNPWVLYNPEVAPTCDVILDAAIDASTIALIICRHTNLL